LHSATTESQHDGQNGMSRPSTTASDAATASSDFDNEFEIPTFLRNK